MSHVRKLGDHIRQLVLNTSMASSPGSSSGSGHLLGSSAGDRAIRSGAAGEGGGVDSDSASHLSGSASHLSGSKKPGSAWAGLMSLGSETSSGLMNGNSKDDESESQPKEVSGTNMSF